jgi:hypothetical protein
MMRLKPVQQQLHVYPVTHVPLCRTYLYLVSCSIFSPNLSNRVLLCLGRISVLCRCDVLAGPPMCRVVKFLNPRVIGL